VRRHQDRRAPIGGRAQRGAGGPRRVRVEAVERLVEERELDRPDERGREPDALVGPIELALLDDGARCAVRSRGPRRRR